MVSRAEAMDTGTDYYVLTVIRYHINVLYRWAAPSPCQRIRAQSGLIYYGFGVCVVSVYRARFESTFIAATRAVQYPPGSECSIDGDAGQGLTYGSRHGTPRSNE